MKLNKTIVTLLATTLVVACGSDDQQKKQVPPTPDKKDVKVEAQVEVTEKEPAFGDNMKELHNRLESIASHVGSGFSHVANKAGQGLSAGYTKAGEGFSAGYEYINAGNSLRDARKKGHSDILKIHNIQLEKIKSAYENGDITKEEALAKGEKAVNQTKSQIKKLVEQTDVHTHLAAASGSFVEKKELELEIVNTAYRQLNTNRKIYDVKIDSIKNRIEADEITLAEGKKLAKKAAEVHNSERSEIIEEANLNEFDLKDYFWGLSVKALDFFSGE
jgi:hypothetical protein